MRKVPQFARFRYWRSKKTIHYFSHVHFTFTDSFQNHFMETINFITVVLEGIEETFSAYEALITYLKLLSIGEFERLCVLLASYELLWEGT